jgi:hypothetical protein
MSKYCVRNVVKTMPWTTHLGMVNISPIYGDDWGMVYYLFYPHYTSSRIPERASSRQAHLRCDEWLSRHHVGLSVAYLDIIQLPDTAGKNGSFKQTKIERTYVGLQLGVVNGYNRGNSNNLRALGYNPYDYNGIRYSIQPTYHWDQQLQTFLDWTPMFV